jgi:hypothetical protein
MCGDQKGLTPVIIIQIRLVRVGVKKTGEKVQNTCLVQNLPEFNETKI